MQVRGISNRRFNNNKNSGKKDRSQSRSKSRPKETRRCYNCDMVGYIARFCRLPKKEKHEDNKSANVNIVANVAKEEKKPGDFYVVADLNSLSDLYVSSCDIAKC